MTLTIVDELAVMPQSPSITGIPTTPTPKGERASNQCLGMQSVPLGDVVDGDKENYDGEVVLSERLTPVPPSELILDTRYPMQMEGEAPKVDQAKPMKRESVFDRLYKSAINKVLRWDIMGLGFKGR
jgi:hypothetical protein